VTRGFDTTANCYSHGQQILDAGYTFVARYLSHSLWKNLTSPEARHLSALGIYIVSVWESAGDHASFFSYSQGAKDARDAAALAENIGQHRGGVIYYAVDFDPNEQQLIGVHNYFRAIHETKVSTGYEVGVYGSGATCKYLSEAGYVSRTWLAQSTGWGGYADWKTKANIVQGPQFSFHGMDCDSDTSNGDAGGWKVELPHKV